MHLVEASNRNLELGDIAKTIFQTSAHHDDEKSAKYQFFPRGRAYRGHVVARGCLRYI